jgi:hypothetical protein
MAKINNALVSATAARFSASGCLNLWHIGADKINAPLNATIPGYR